MYGKDFVELLGIFLELMEVGKTVDIGFLLYIGLGIFFFNLNIYNK